MFRRLFNPDSDLMILLTWITDCIFLSLFWLMACLPVVTIGAATAALYDATYRGFRRGEKNTWQRFGRSLLRNLKSSILPTILALAVFIGGGQLLIHLWNGAVASGQWVGFSAAALAGVVVLGMLSILFPLLSRFETGFMQLLVNTVRLALGNLPRAIALGILSALTVWLCLWFVLPALLLPCIVTLLNTLFIEPMLRPFLPADFYGDAEEEAQ